MPKTPRMRQRAVVVFGTNVRGKCVATTSPALNRAVIDQAKADGFCVVIGNGFVELWR